MSKRIDNVNELLNHQYVSIGSKQVGAWLNDLVEYENQRGGSFDNSIMWILFRAYTLGFIEGKRAERKHRAETEEARTFQDTMNFIKDIRKDKALADFIGLELSK